MGIIYLLSYKTKLNGYRFAFDQPFFLRINLHNFFIEYFLFWQDTRNEHTNKIISESKKQLHQVTRKMQLCDPQPI